MKGKKETIGVIPKEVIFQARKKRHSVSFRCGAHGSAKPPRERFSPLDYNEDDWTGEEENYAYS